MAVVCRGQTAQPAATPDELKFFQFMLMNLASIDHSPDAVTSYSKLLGRQFGLNDTETGILNSAAVTLRTQLQQIRSSTTNIVSRNQVLSAADRAALQALIINRNQLVQTLANQILNSVRPITATRLRMPGHIMANILKEN